MKKGFTLIELLAVIVILAIIALIATPIVITIISDSSASTAVRAGEFYVGAVENAIMSKNIDTGGSFNPTECNIDSFGNVKCGETTLVIEVEGEKPVGGFLKYDEGNLVDAKIEFTEDKIVMNEAGTLSSLENDIVCQKVTEETKTTGNVPEGNFLLGDEYICEVKEGEAYHFFVLSINGDNINLILEKNIDGKVEWYALENNNTYGPLTANEFLNNATKEWEKIKNLSEEYTDNAYGKLSITGKARLPKFSELVDAGCKNGSVPTTGPCTKCGYCPLWLVNYLNESQYVVGDGVKYATTSITGYWVLTSRDNTSSAWTINNNNIIQSRATNVTAYGIRPVISVPKSDIY